MSEGFRQGEDGLAEALPGSALIGIAPQESRQPFARRRLARRQRQISDQGLRLAQIEEDRPAFRVFQRELAEKAQGPNQRLRVGGLVADGSVLRGAGETISFDVTDGAATQKVIFTGVLPDLFREGQGVIAEGYLRDGVFEADNILAKHDEDYIPREVAEALKEQGHYKGENE